NWSRAVDVLRELRDQAGAGTAPLVKLLLDCTLLLVDAPFGDNIPEAVQSALQMLGDGQMSDAAHLLLTAETPDDGVRRVQWLLAERISAHAPEVMLLRPNLYRLDLALAALAGDGIALAEARTALSEIHNVLESNSQSRSLAALRDTYRTAVDRLNLLNTLLSTLAVQHNLSNRKLPLSSLDRAANAAMALADNMHVVGKQATSSPRDALGALDSSRAIDPTSDAWDGIGAMLDLLYKLLGSYQTYVPAADGSDLELWFKTTQAELAPFLGNLFDELLSEIVTGLKTADQAWGDYAAAALQGDRTTVIATLTTAIDAVTTLSPTLSGWLNQLRAVVDGANYIERHALYGGLGRALADGWEAFDRGRLADAERLGQQAYEIARSEPERFAAQRLRDLTRLTRDWVERNAVLSAARTQTALAAVEALFTPDELKQRDNFNAQMPSKETFLRAMTKGIVELFQRRSTAPARILTVAYVMLGALDAHDDLLDDALFWREAALRVLGEGGSKQLIVRTLDEFVDRRRDLLRISGLLNGLHDTESLKRLEQTRRLVEENPQAKTVSAALQSVRDFEVAIRDWADGDFRAAGLKLESALKAVDDAEAAADLKLPAYRAWLGKLTTAAADLHVTARTLRGSIEKRPDAPDDAIRNAHHKLAQISAQLLGVESAAALIGWRDTYERFLGVYIDKSTRRSQKLERFNELFRAMFIDRHPAYALYRHWVDLTERAPEFPAPPTSDPTPRIDERPPLDTSDGDTAPSRYDDLLTPNAPRRVSPVLIVAIVVGVGLAMLIGITLLNRGAANGDQNLGAGFALTLSQTPTATVSPSATARPTTAPVTATPRPPTLTRTPAPTRTATIAATLSTPTDSATPAPPTQTFTPSMTFTASATPTLTPTATLTLPPGGLQGSQNLLDLLPRLSADEIGWTPEQFSLGPRGEYWRFGVGADTPGAEISIALLPSTLDAFYGGDAPVRIRRAEATLSLLTANPQLPPEQVYFGLALRSAAGDEIGLYIQAVNLTTINVYQRVNGELTFIVQQATNFITARMRLDRDPATGNVTLVLNDAAIGQPLAFVAPDAPVVPLLFVGDGGVVVSVTDWRVTLR
ncbi:MAG: hypothetical protein H7Y11_14815, partial [Armatimonadetes bacterium]|nr:hypothetical protein [Anaerolineae bacterium]